MSKEKKINIIIAIIMVVGGAMIVAALFQINNTEFNEWRKPVYIIGTILFAGGLASSICRGMKGPYF